jgi:hypothetical protein
MYLRDKLSLHKISKRTGPFGSLDVLPAPTWLAVLDLRLPAEPQHVKQVAAERLRGQCPQPDVEDRNQGESGEAKHHVSVRVQPVGYEKQSDRASVRDHRRPEGGWGVPVACHRDKHGHGPDDQDQESKDFHMFIFLTAKIYSSRDEEVEAAFDLMLTFVYSQVLDR